MNDRQLVHELLKDYSDRIRRVENTTDLNNRIYPIISKYLELLHKRFMSTGLIILIPDSEDCPYRWLNFWPELGNDPYFFVDAWNFDGCHVYFTYIDKKSGWEGQFGVHVPFDCLSNDGVERYFFFILTQLKERHIRLREKLQKEMSSEDLIIETLSKHLTTSAGS